MSKSDTNVTTPYFRVSYPNLFKSKLNTLNGKQEFSVTALFKKGEDLSGMERVMKNAMENRFGKDEAAWPADFRKPFKMQSDKGVDGVLPEGHEDGAVYCEFKTENRPTVVDKDREEIIDPSMLYAGCWARAAVNANAYDQGGNKGVTFWLNHVQFYKDDSPLSNRPSVDSAFKTNENDIF